MTKLSKHPRSGRILKYLTLSVMGCTIAVSAANAGSKLSESELMDQLVGKKLEFQTPDGATGFVRYSRNGKAKLWEGNFEPNRDRGNWWIKGNSLCNQWKVVRNGTAACSSFKSTGEGSYISSKGTKVWVH